MNVNKIEDAGELPGLMIEEMMESASMVQGEEGVVKENDEKVDKSDNCYKLLTVTTSLSKVFSAPWQLKPVRAWWR